MKNINKYIAYLFLVCFAFSCSEEKLIDKIYSDTGRGLVLRTIGDSNSFDVIDPSGTWTVSLEIQDEEDGGLLSEVRVYFTFVDNNDDPSDDTSTEALVGTYPASHFSGTGEFGLPTGDVSLSYQEALTAAGITLADVLPGDSFFFRLEAELTDGRVFTNDANGTVTGGTFFASPYQYTETLDDGIEFELEDINRNVVDVTEGGVNDDFLIGISIDMSDEDFSEADYIESVTIYRSFADRSITEENPDISEDEAVFAEIDLADFTEEDGVYMYELGFTQDELYGANIEFEDLVANDEFRLRYELNMVDGRKITSTEADTEYFSAYTVFECVQLNADAPYPGEYTFDMKDVYEDDWNGGYLTVVIDGVALEDTFAAEGAGSTGSFTVPEGTTTFEFFYTSGDWDEENTWTLYDPNGNPAATGGPYPNGNGLPPAVYPGGEILVCE